MEALALVLGTYAVTLALTASEGPWGLFYKLRAIKRVQDFGVLECFLCTSFWVSLILCLSFGRPEIILIAWGSSTLIDKVVMAYSVKNLT